MASKKPLSALGDKSATDVTKLGSQGLAKHVAEINSPFLSATDLVNAFSTQSLAKRLADITASNNALTNLGEGLSPPSHALFANATDLAKVLSQASISSDLAEHLPAKIDIQLPDMSQGVRVSLPHLIQDSYQEQNMGDEKAIASPAIHGTEVKELEVVSPSDLGLLVRRARETRHLSQQSFADLSGVGRRFLSELENGKPTLELGKVLKVARTAGISLFARQR
jgi:y4mF family transcriptional regulator